MYVEPCRVDSTLRQALEHSFDPDAVQRLAQGFNLLATELACGQHLHTDLPASLAGFEAGQLMAAHSAAAPVPHGLTMGLTCACQYTTCPMLHSPWPPGIRESAQYQCTWQDAHGISLSGRSMP